MWTIKRILQNFWKSDDSSFLGGWKNDNATFLVSENKTRCLLGLDLQGSLGIDTVQRNPPQVKIVQNVVENSTSELNKSHFVTKYPLLFTRLVRSKSHQTHTTFMEPLIPRQIKGRKVPIHIQDRVSEELKSLVRDGHITKLDKCTTNHFINSIVITAKKEGSIKLAMDAKPLNAQVWKNKYQMPNIQQLIDLAAQITTSDVPDSVWFSSLDMKYAFSQIKLSELTSIHCNFNIICGESTVTYRFNTGFYGLTDMPSEFQKAMDCTLQGILITICYLDDILVVSKGKLSQHSEIVHKILTRLDEEGLALKLSKCEFVVDKLDRLGFEIHSSGYAPKFSKIDAVRNLKAPRTPKQLQSFMGTLNHFQKFKRGLHNLTCEIRDSLKICYKRKFIWNEPLDADFQKILELVAKITDLYHYDSARRLKKVCGYLYRLPHVFSILLNLNIVLMNWSC